MVKTLLKRYKYPPDKQDEATETVLRQAETLSAEWAWLNRESCLVCASPEADASPKLCYQDSWGVLPEFRGSDTRPVKWILDPFYTSHNLYYVKSQKYPLQAPFVY